MRYFSTNHEWVAYENGKATLGISRYAADELGDITFVELPETGQTFKKGDSLCVIESVKAASDVYAPVGGEIESINSDLEEQPELVNESPEEKGWLCTLNGVKEADLQGLMSEEDYKAFLEQQ